MTKPSMPEKHYFFEEVQPEGLTVQQIDAAAGDIELADLEVALDWLNTNFVPSGEATQDERWLDTLHYDLESRIALRRVVGRSDARHILNQRSKDHLGDKVLPDKPPATDDLDL